MAAYRRVDDLRSLRADCLYTGIRSWPNARYRVWEAITFTFIQLLLSLTVETAHHPTVEIAPFMAAFTCADPVQSGSPRLQRQVCSPIGVGLPPLSSSVTVSKLV